MARPLDVESKFYKFMSVTDFNLLMVAIALDVLLFFALTIAFGIDFGLFCFFLILTVVTTFLIQKGKYPENYIFHKFSFFQNNQKFFPSREKSEVEDL